MMLLGFGSVQQFFLLGLVSYEKDTRDHYCIVTVQLLSILDVEWLSSGGNANFGSVGRYSYLGLLRATTTQLHHDGSENERAKKEDVPGLFSNLGSTENPIRFTPGVAQELIPSATPDTWDSRTTHGKGHAKNSSFRKHICYPETKWSTKLTSSTAENVNLPSRTLGSPQLWFLRERS